MAKIIINYHAFKRAGKASRGFTLLEVLVAISIFALISAMAYSGLITILNAQEQTDAAAIKLKQLQTTLFFLERDVRYSVARDVRDSFGDIQPAMTGNSNLEPGLSLTRTGRSNPLQKKRSALERVRYSLKDKQLMRSSLPVLDSVQETIPLASKLMDGVERLEFRFLSAKREWLDTWPPIATDKVNTSILPLAVEVTMETMQWGKIVRMIAISG